MWEWAGRMNNIQACAREIVDRKIIYHFNLEWLQNFQKVRSELQSKGMKSAKRALKRISRRENRWMSDVNHRLSKTLVTEYGAGTLFVLEDLKGGSFSDDLLGKRSAKDRQELRAWTFYQFEQDLTYKHISAGHILAEEKSGRCQSPGDVIDKPFNPDECMRESVEILRPLAEKRE